MNAHIEEGVKIKPITVGKWEVLPKGNCNVFMECESITVYIRIGA